MAQPERDDKTDRSAPPPSASTGRPRSEEAHQAILDATLELLIEVGFSGLTVEGVAQRAGVGKATIYRRWPSKLPLIVEAFGELPGFEEVDSGSLEVDLKETLKRYLEAFNATSLGAVFPSLAGERAHNPELSKLLEPVARSRREPFVRIFERARERGEIADDVDIGLAADLVVGPISVTLFFRGGTPSPRMVGPIVDLALHGILRRRDD
ncbi:MAG: TetR/AcrR family transcriptional regulator [Spirochaetaceae bacterium]|nr:TetR/AcrR family transcriptional regulator [Myxococcales bacterium]MCB9722732.1 TetR/AcrR family transcriptional regulator [Spirochaetaceae bacterium]HPG29060.1 TetR/AcrR family transcriptional regulator [Myxococcota bacterium]